MIKPIDIGEARAKKVKVEGRQPPDLEALSRKSRAMALAKPHQVHVDHDLTRYVDESIVILRGDESMFERAGALVRIRGAAGKRNRTPVQRELGAPMIEQYPVPSMREQLIRRTYFFEIGELEDDKGNVSKVDVDVPIPADLVRTLRARGRWPGVRPLTGIVTAPTLRADGSILQTPGYDEASGLYYDDDGCNFPVVPDRPSQAQAKRAVHRLLEVVCDVPFATDEHRAAWVALVLTTIGRTFVNGCTPLFAIDANIRGAGKSLLADTVSLIATGRSAPRMAQPESDAESRKCITSLLLEGDRMCLIDNVSRPLGSASLDALLTSEIWKDRVLGQSKVATLPNNCVWMATGNNLEFGGDTVRRTLHLRLDSPDENPEDREDFRHPDLRAYVRQHRGELATAALTILRGYVVAGMPQKVRLWGSFEPWSKKIAAACMWVGLPDPQVTRIELEAASDTDKASLSALMHDWGRLFPRGSTAKNTIEILYPRLERGEHRPADEWDGMRAAIEELARPAPGRAPESSKLGYALRARKKRVVGSSMFEGSSKTRSGVVVWRVVQRKET